MQLEEWNWSGQSLVAIGLLRRVPIRCWCGRGICTASLGAQATQMQNYYIEQIARLILRGGTVCQIVLKDCERLAGSHQVENDAGQFVGSRSDGFRCTQLRSHAAVEVAQRGFAVVQRLCCHA